MPSFHSEDVRGIVIGDFTRRVQLVSPRGTISAEAHLGYDIDCIAWAKARKEEILNRKCGDGTRLGDHQDLCAEIFGPGEWECRFWD